MDELSQDIRHLDQEVFLTINDEELSNLCLEIDKYSDNIALIFNQIDDEMNNLKDSYKANSSIAIINYYNELKKNYSIIKNNINSYAEDLRDLSIKVKSGFKDVALFVRSENEGIKTKIKAINDRRK